MLNYLLKRLAISLPVLWIISLATFFLNQCAPVDMVRALRPEFVAQTFDENQREANYRRDAEAFGLDLPLFYFTLTTAAYPDTFHHILLPEKKEWLDALTAQTGNWEAVQYCAKTLVEFEKKVETLPDSADKPQLRLHINLLRNTKNINELCKIAIQLDTHFVAPPHPNAPARAIAETVKSAFQDLERNQTHLKMWIPAFYWHGTRNQYHQWLVNFFTGNLGISLVTREPVAKLIQQRLGRSLFLNGTSILLAFLISLPLGLWAARRANTIFDRWLGRFIMAVYAMPIFWLGGLLIMAFATNGIGYRIFSVGANPQDMQSNTFQWVVNNWRSLVLPIVTMMLHALATLFLQMRSAALRVQPENFVRTARAKGLSEKQVFGKHIFRNALFPVITILGGVFPAVFAGSLLIEIVFSVPAIGAKIFEAFAGRDYPLLMATTMIAAILTIVGQLVADLLYAIADPRVRLQGDS